MSRSGRVLVLLLAAAAALRVWGIDFGLPHPMTRPDEEAVFTVAMRFFGRTLNPGFLDWPSLFMSIVAIGYVAYFNIGRLIGWFPHEYTFVAAASSNAAPLFLIARVISACAGVLTVYSTFRIGSLLFDRTVALVAAAFVAVAALHVRESHFGLPDVTATLLATLSFMYTAAYWRTRRNRDALLSAMWAGLAASTKYNAAIVVLPAVWAIAVPYATDGAERSRLRLLLGYGCVAAAAFVFGTPYALLDPAAFLSALRAISAHLQGGHAALAGYAWGIHLTSSLRFGIGLPMLTAGIGGLALYCWRDWREGVLFALFPVTYFVLIGSGQTAFARYILPTVPFLCIAAALVTVEIARALGEWSGRPAMAATFVSLFGAVVAAAPGWTAIETDAILSRTDNRVLAARWIADQFPRGATLYQSGSIYGHLHMPGVASQTGDLYREALFNDQTATFTRSDGSSTEPPDIIVTSSCPLAYCDAPSALAKVLEGYVLLRSFAAVTSPSSPVYDRDDAFFVPLARFEGVVRPGPNLQIYARRR